MIKKGRSYTYITVLGALIFSVMIFISSTSIIAWLAISSFVLHEFSRGGHEPVQLAFINKLADEKKRATILSFESMISTVGSALGLLFFGYFAEHSSIAKSWFLAAVIVLVVIPLYLKARRKEQSSEMLISS